MENELKERIRHLLRNKNVTILDLAGSETQRVRITRQLNNHTADITLSTIMLILTRFPEVSAEWLLRGEGTMDKSGHYAPKIYASGGSIVQGGNNSGDALISTPSQYELYGKDVLISAKDAEIANLHDQIVELKQDKRTLTLILNSFTNRMQ